MSNNYESTDFFRPWNVAHGREAVRNYVASLGDEGHEWLLALFVDEKLQLLAVDTVAQGDIASCSIPFGRLMMHAYQLKAAGYILVHNHPSGDPRPSTSDILLTAQLARKSADLGVRLLDHLIVAGDDLISCGYF